MLKLAHSFIPERNICQIRDHLEYRFLIPSLPQTMRSQQNTESERKTSPVRWDAARRAARAVCMKHHSWKWKAGVIFAFLAALFPRSRSKQDILVSIWLIFHAKASCCYRTNSKRKRRRFVLDLVCVDDVSQNFRPAALSTCDKVHWQILGDRRLQWSRCYTAH